MESFCMFTAAVRRRSGAAVQGNAGAKAQKRGKKYKKVASTVVFLSPRALRDESLSTRSYGVLTYFLLAIIGDQAQKKENVNKP